MRLKRKYSKDQVFIGTVGNKSIMAGGRTKREAEKRLRRLFTAELPEAVHASIGSMEVNLFEHMRNVDAMTVKKAARGR